MIYNKQSGNLKLSSAFTIHEAKSIFYNEKGRAFGFLLFFTYEFLILNVLCALRLAGEHPSIISFNNYYLTKTWTDIIQTN